MTSFLFLMMTLAAVAIYGQVLILVADVRPTEKNIKAGRRGYLIRVAAGAAMILIVAVSYLTGQFHH